MKLTREHLLKPLLLIAFGILLYANSFSVPFQFDDQVVIVDNTAIQRLPDWPATIRSIFDFQPSRFLTLLTFALNYSAHRLQTGGYHAVNVLIHILTGFVVWRLGEWLLAWTNRDKKPRKGKKEAPAGDWREHVPFIAALLFLAHPVNTQAVTYLAQRAEELSALFYVVSVCCFLNARGVKKTAARWWILCVLSGILAMLSKETSITLPLTIIMAEFFFFRQGKIPTAAIGWGALALLIVPALFRFDLAILTQTYQSQSHLGDVLSLPTYLLTQLRVFAVFLRLLFFPVGLNLDHDFVMSRSLFEPAAFLSLVLIAAVLYGAFRYREKYPMLSFAAFWFFLTLSSNLIPRSHVMFEHKMYLALTGTIPALCLGLYDIFRDRRTVIAFGIVLVAFSLLTIQRNKVWQSPITLWEDVVRKSPNKGRAHLSLGAAYASSGNYEKGIAHLNRAAELMNDPYVYTTRGSAYSLKKDDERALADFDQAIRLEPNYTNAYIGRGEVRGRLKQYGGAMADFNKAIEVRPDKADAYKMRGRLNDVMRRYDAALADYGRALELNPADAQTVAWRGYLLAVAGRKEESLKDFEEAIRLDPGFAEGYVYRGMHRKESGRRDEALADLNKAIKLRPTALGYYQRATLFFESGRFSEAMTDVNRAVELDPKYDLAYGLRARLFVEEKKLPQALADLNKSIEANPEYLDGYLNRSLLLRNRGDLDLAVADLTKALELNPGAFGVYSRRAKLYVLMKKYDLALKDVETVMKIDPRSGLLYFNRSLIYKEMGQFGRAHEDALKAKELGFDVPPQYLQELQGQK